MKFFLLLKATELSGAACGVKCLGCVTDRKLYVLSIHLVRMSLKAKGRVEKHSSNYWES